MRRAVFLDRDGVINVNRPEYVRSWAEFEFLPNSLEALRRLAALDVAVVVVSNQSAVGRGLIGVEVVEEINARMLEEVRAAGGRVDGVYYCPHAPEEGCDCRKPKAGMLKRAAEELGVVLTESYLVGDAESDMVAGLSVGARVVLVMTGRGRSQLEMMGGARGRFMVVEDLLEAVQWIEEQEAIDE
jgi:histidinol-phosphate phosphatase family protein